MWSCLELFLRSLRRTVAVKDKSPTESSPLPVPPRVCSLTLAYFPSESVQENHQTAGLPLPVPPEVCSLILSHLPSESVVAFALTCRRSYHQFMLPHSHLTEDARRTLLLWLERDTPNLYFCHRCTDLHTWRRVHRDPGIAHYDKCCRNRWNSPFLPGPPHTSYRLDFHIARLIINRHLHGEAHGPPLDALSYTAEKYDLGDSQDGVLVRQSWRGRIIDDELCLEASVQLYHDKGRTRILRQHLDKAAGETRTLGCGDVLVLGRSSNIMKPAQYPIRELDREPNSPELFVPVTGTLKSCRSCFTDYRLDVAWHALDSSGPKGWVISVTRWHQLGSCRSPEDTKWNNFIKYYFDVTPNLRIETCEAGGVYRNWRKQDIGTTELIGQESDWGIDACFVDPPRAS